ncbi:ribonuclease R [Spirulina sp. CS-785/01]|uniref:ribonuclease catalytic domain-containing protein n=1 Tax=Spirulina sp. CS-785/01 TaxID=3021716 RepID=UPI00232EAD0F|nr:ribonuclease R family protein [Spirulina sp. CS-785/01]MDB9313833.1 ribonuclease R [Spirulina sp. CS-785/01]
MDKGTLIEFRLQGERRLAVAERPEGKKNWIFVDERGQSHSLKPQRVEYAITGDYEPSDLPKFREALDPYLDASNLEVAWELLVEDGEAVTPESLAQLLYSDESPSVCYAAHLLLVEDKIYFKKKGDKYEPRPQSQVEEIKHQLAVEEQREQEKQAFFERVQQALAQDSVEWQESDRSRLESLERLVLQPETNHRAAQEILEALNRPPTAQAAFDLLVELGCWSNHENLFLRRSSYPLQFPQKVLDVAQSRLNTPTSEIEQDIRLDLTHLKVYTVDDESTQEIDDGLSVEYLDHGRVKLWVHIADPTRLLDLGDELDLEARRRSTSLYLPTGMIPMFPKELATGPMSLIQGQVCYALSFGVVLDETGAIEDYTIQATQIKPTYRLTYDDVDEMLELGVQAEPELAELAHAAQLRSQWRKSQGAINIHMPEAQIKVKNEEEIAIELLDDSTSRELVAEMMILCGEVTGRYAQDQNLPLPFRGQPQPELPPEEELLLLPPGPVRFCAMRRCMPRSEMSITPVRHAGLGLDVYTQVTSPIRRYTDLLTHFQIKAHLRGEELPLNADELQAIVFSVTSASQEATLVERQTNRYWGLEYLRRHPNEVWQAIVLRWLREDDNLCLILLEELGLELPHRLNRSVELGDRIEVQVSTADPRNDVIRFRECLTPEIEAATP